ncbi:hypothetical protein [Nocardia beijingensis]|uniref:hypothetical protein n=1 Tax=Nocardia beijingensis TaxID=95162 RepID=UPI0033BECC6F
MTTLATVQSLLGVSVAEPCGKVRIHSDGWVEVGALIVDDNGSIKAVPTWGITDYERTVLTAMAEQVAVLGRDSLTCWRYHERLGWVVSVLVRTMKGVLA